MNLAFLIIVGASFSMPLQAFVEQAIMERPWMNTWAKKFKPLIPSLISIVAGYIAVKFGFDSKDVTAVISALVFGTHVVNETPLASVAK